MTSDVPDYIFCFFISRIELAELDHISIFVLCPESFFFSSMIVPDHGIGSIQDIAGRTVILFQFDHLGIIKYMFKIQDVLNVRTAEFINGLIIVANHAQVTVLGCQQMDQFELYCIRILILVYHDITETLLIIFQYIFLRLEKLHRLKQQIVKI